MSRRSANGSQQWLAGEIPETVIPVNLPTLTLTAQLQAVAFANGTAVGRWKQDLAGMNQIRLTSAVTLGSASVNTPKLFIGYSLVTTTVPASYIQIGATNVECSLTTAGLIDSGWIDILPAARVNDCFLGFMGSGGDGAQNPAIGFTHVHFR